MNKKKDSRKRPLMKVVRITGTGLLALLFAMLLGGCVPQTEQARAIVDTADKCKKLKAEGRECTKEELDKMSPIHGELKGKILSDRADGYIRIYSFVDTEKDNQEYLIVEDTRGHVSVVPRQSGKNGAQAIFDIITESQNKDGEKKDDEKKDDKQNDGKQNNGLLVPIDPKHRGEQDPFNDDFERLQKMLEEFAKARQRGR